MAKRQQYSLQISRRKGQEGVWSDRYVEKYMKHYDPHKKDEDGNPIEDGEISAVDYYDNSRSLEICLVCWGKEPLILRKGRNIETQRCDGHGNIKRVIPKGSHTGYSAKGYAMLFDMGWEKHITIWMWDTIDVPCRGCQRCRKPVGRLKRISDRIRKRIGLAV